MLTGQVDDPFFSLELATTPDHLRLDLGGESMKNLLLVRSLGLGNDFGAGQKSRVVGLVLNG